MEVTIEKIELTLEQKDICFYLDKETATLNQLNETIIEMATHFKFLDSLISRGEYKEAYKESLILKTLSKIKASYLLKIFDANIDYIQNNVWLIENEQEKKIGE